MRFIIVTKAGSNKKVFVWLGNVKTMYRNGGTTYIEPNYSRFSAEGVETEPVLEVKETLKQIADMLSEDELPTTWKGKGLKETP